jgi:nucleotidyltransferase substrate binding protein (TIGR01987 family)
MDTQRLNERINEYRRACSQLAKACAQPKNEFIRDSVIQRFEFCHELSWKMLKLKLAYESISVNTPREAFQEGLQTNLISDGNAWTDMQKMRNLTSHTYDETLAETVYQYIVEHGLITLESLAKQCTQWHIDQ